MNETTVKTLLAGAFMGAAFAAHAEGAYVGVEVGQVSYPDYTTDSVNFLASQGATFASTTQAVTGTSVGVHVGQWVTRSFGFEVGYTDLGSVDGSFTSNVLSGTYSYSANAFHGEVLGGIPLGRGTLFGKVGLFSAKTTLNDNCSICTPTQSVTSTGLLVGGGYEFFFTRKFSGRASLNVYNGMKFINEGTYLTENKSITQLAVGVNYLF